MNHEDNWDQLVLNVLGNAVEDVEYFNLLPLLVENYYLPKEAPWEKVVSTTLCLLKELLDNDWIVVYGNMTDVVPSTENGTNELFLWAQSKWKEIDFQFPPHGKVLWYELSPQGQKYYQANRQRRLDPSAPKKTQ